MFRVILALGLVLTIASCEQVGLAPAVAGPPEGINVEPVERGFIMDIVPAIGEIHSASEVEIGAEVSGRIIEIGANFDDAVREGEVLARIDPEPFEVVLERATALLDAARALQEEVAVRLEQSRLDLERAEALSTGGAGSPARAADARLEVRQLQATLENAEANVALAQSQVRQAQIELQRTVVLSPIDGFILDRRVEVGQAVNASLSAPVLFVVAADLSNVVIEAEVAEADVGRITAGMEARITVDAYPREIFFGRASPVRRSPRRDGRFVTYPVLIEASDNRERLLPGMTASVEFIAAEARDVLIAPRRAFAVPPPPGFQPPEEVAEYLRSRLGLGPDEPFPATAEVAARIYGAALGIAARDQMRILFIWHDGQVELRQVRPGAENQTHFEIAAGELELGDLVIVNVHDERF